MDPIDFLPSGLLSGLGEAVARSPDYLWSAAASAVATLTLALAIAPRRRALPTRTI